MVLLMSPNEFVILFIDHLQRMIHRLCPRDLPLLISHTFGNNFNRVEVIIIKRVRHSQLKGGRVL